MPKVQDQDDPLFVLVPDLVVEGVVEHEDLALGPAHELVGDPHPGPVLGSGLGVADLEGEMGPEPAVGGTRVGVSVSSWSHEAELDLRDQV